MHVCGSHEQAIARFGLRTGFPRDLHVIMGPGCPVCITDQPEVDEAVALARQGVRIATYGDMVRVPGIVGVAGRRAGGRRARRGRLQHRSGDRAGARSQTEPLVFFAHRFRDDRRGHRRRHSRRAAAELLRAVGAQVHPAGDGDRRRDARLARSKVSSRPDMPRRSPDGACSRRSSRVTGAGRRRRLRAARHPGGAGASGRADPRSPADGREHVSALRDARGQPGGAAPAVAGVRAHRRTLARDRARARTATCACATSGPTSTRGAVSRSISTRCGTRRRRSCRSSACAATSCRA